MRPKLEGPQQILDVLEHVTPARRLATCPGAVVHVTPEEYRRLERDAGIRWATRSDELGLLGEERTAARVECSAEVRVVERGGARYTSGRCDACAAIEAEERAAIARRKQDAERKQHAGYPAR